jgi:hypothetical protein
MGVDYNVCSKCNESVCEYNCFSGEHLLLELLDDKNNLTKEEYNMIENLSFGDHICDLCLYNKYGIVLNGLDNYDEIDNHLEKEIQKFKEDHSYIDKIQELLKWEEDDIDTTEDDDDDDKIEEIKKEIKELIKSFNKMKKKDILNKLKEIDDLF